MAYIRKAISGSSVVLAFNILAGLMGYIVRILYARQLSVGEFGLFYSMIALVNLIYGFKSPGLNQAIVKYIPEWLVKKELGKIKGAIVWATVIQISIAAIFTIVLWFLSGFLAKYFFKSLDAAYFLRMLIIGGFLLSAVDLMRYVMQGYQRHAWFSLYDLFVMSSVLVLSLAGFYIVKEKGIMTPVLAYTLYPIIVGIIYCSLFLSKTFPCFFSTKSSLMRLDKKEMFSYGFPLLLATTGSLILGQTDIIILTYFRNSVEVSLYNTSLPAAKILIYAGISVSMVTFPMIAELVAKNDYNELKGFLEKIFAFSAFLFIPSAIIFFCFPTLILKTLFGLRYIGANQSLQILSVGMLFWSFALVGLSVIKGLGDSKKVTKIILMGAGMNLIMNFVFIPLWGFIGASITTAACYFVMFLLTIFDLKKLIFAQKY